MVTKLSSSPDPEPILATESVWKTYPAAVPVTALANVSLAIWPGELVAIRGRSGSGKSTLLGVLGLLDIPSAGDVRVAGESAARLSDAKRSRLRAHYIGFVFQQFHLVGHLDAAANVEAALRFRGLAMRERRSLAMDALGRVGLTLRASHRPAELSGGEQQRVAIARAVVTRPRVILADEPTGNLDTDSAALVLAQLESLTSDGAAVVVATHDADVAARASRQFAMRDGRLEGQL